MFRPLGIKVFSLWIETNSILSLSEFDLGKSLGNLMYSNICIVIMGSTWSLWLPKCLATVVLLLCLMSNIWPWNLSMILFLVCPTYFVWHQLHSIQYIKLLLWHGDTQQGVNILHLITEVKQSQAQLIHGWVTVLLAWLHSVIHY